MMKNSVNYPIKPSKSFSLMYSANHRPYSHFTMIQLQSRFHQPNRIHHCGCYHTYEISNNFCLKSTLVEFLESLTSKSSWHHVNNRRIWHKNICFVPESFRRRICVKIHSSKFSILKIFTELLTLRVQPQLNSVLILCTVPRLLLFWRYV